MPNNDTANSWELPANHMTLREAVEAGDICYPSWTDADHLYWWATAISRWMEKHGHTWPQHRTFTFWRPSSTAQVSLVLFEQRRHTAAEIIQTEFPYTDQHAI
jgi:hypothetical protein